MKPRITVSPPPGQRNIGQMIEGEFSARVPVGLDALVESLEHAEAWAESGYSPESRAYWAGMRDTLRVLLGVTTTPPLDNTEDAAAVVLLGAQARAGARKKG